MALFRLTFLFVLLVCSTAAAQNTAWHVDVNDSGTIHNGLSSSPFLSFAAVFGPGGPSLSPGDEVWVAPGNYDAVSLGGLETWGYTVPSGVKIRFWDRAGALPSDPGFVECNGAGQLFGLRFFEGGVVAASGVFGWLSALSVPDKQRIRFSEFFEAAIDVRPNSATWVDGSQVSIDGVVFRDCAVALDFASLDVSREMRVTLARSDISTPSSTSLAAKDRPMIRVTEVGSGTSGRLDLLVESVNIVPADIAHSGTAIACVTDDCRDGSSFEFRGVYVGAQTPGSTPGFAGAGLEMLGRFESEFLLLIRNSTIRDCWGNGVLAEVRGENVLGSLQCENATVRNCGLTAPTGSPYFYPWFTFAFDRSGIMVVANENARWSQVSLNGVQCFKNGEHGLHLRSNGAVEFPRSFPNVDVFKSSLSYNGQVGIGPRSDGIHCSLQNDGIHLDVEQCLVRSNRTSGVGVNVYQVDPVYLKRIELDFANCVVTENQGILPTGASPQFGAAIHYSVDNQYATGWVRLSHMTITGSVCDHALAVYNTSDTQDVTTAMWGDESLVENSVLRDNGRPGSGVDTSFHPLPGTARWTKMFDSTHYSDLESTGVPLSNLYTLANENFYVDPEFRQYSFLNWNLGVVFPATALTTPSGSSPLVDRGRLPVFNSGGVDGRGFPRPVDHLSFSNYLGVSVHDVGAIEVQGGE